MCAGGTPPMFMAIDTVGGEQQQIYRCYIIKEFKQANEIHILLCIRWIMVPPTVSELQVQCR